MLDVDIVEFLIIAMMFECQLKTEVLKMSQKGPVKQELEDLDLNFGR